MIRFSTRYLSWYESSQQWAEKLQRRNPQLLVLLQNVCSGVNLVSKVLERCNLIAEFHSCSLYYKIFVLVCIQLAKH